MSQRLNAPPSGHSSPAIDEYLLLNEEPWNCWHLRLRGAEFTQPQPLLLSTSPTGWSTVSNGSSVQDEDELSARVDLLALTSALSIHDRFPETLGSFTEHHQDFGQVFAGSSATDVTAGLGPSWSDTGHATRPQAAPSAKSFGEICEREEAISAAAPQVRYFGCPFSKHTPVRYEHVMNACVHRPGWPELKRVLEHLHKVHSKKRRCERCRMQYPRQNDFEEHQRKHECKKVEETDPKYPELMTAEQEAIFKEEFGSMTYEDKWRAYYKFLFPDASNRHSIDPYYDYTTLTHLLDPLAVGLPSQKRPASPSLKPEERRQYKRQSRGMAPIITQAGSFVTKSSDASPPPSQVEGNPQSQCRGRRGFTKTPQASSFTQSSDLSPTSHPEESPQSQRRERRMSAKTSQERSFTKQSVGSPYYPPPELAQQVHQDLSYQHIGTSGFTHIALEPTKIEYGYGSGDGKIPSVDQGQEIWTKKCVDDASQSINLESAYGSRDERTIYSTNPHASIMLPSIPPKLDRGDSGIALSSNTSVLTGPAATQPQSGSVVQDVRDPIPPPYFAPPDLDPNLPSNMIAPEEQNYLGFSSGGLLDPNLYESLDYNDQKST